MRCYTFLAKLGTDKYNTSSFVVQFGKCALEEDRLAHRAFLTLASKVVVVTPVRGRRARKAAEWTAIGITTYMSGGGRRPTEVEEDTNVHQSAPTSNKIRE